MICTKCEKKIESPTLVCKYCKEPVVLEGVSPVEAIAAQQSTAEDASCVSIRAHAPCRKDTKKKFVPMIAGALCALIVVLVLASILLPGRIGNKASKRSSTPASAKDKITDIYDAAGSKKEDKKDKKEKKAEKEKKNIKKDKKQKPAKDDK